MEGIKGHRRDFYFGENPYLENEEREPCALSASAKREIQKGGRRTSKSDAEQSQQEEARGPGPCRSPDRLHRGRQASRGHPRWPLARSTAAPLVPGEGNVKGKVRPTREAGRKERRTHWTLVESDLHVFSINSVPGAVAAPPPAVTVALLASSLSSLHGSHLTWGPRPCWGESHTRVLDSFSSLLSQTNHSGSPAPSPVGYRKPSWSPTPRVPVEGGGARPRGGLPASPPVCTLGSEATCVCENRDR